MKHSILHYYRAARLHQLRTNGGGAAPGYHAVAALNSARSMVRFRARLSASVKQHKRRSAAARRGWRTRRSAQQ